MYLRAQMWPLNRTARAILTAALAVGCGAKAEEELPFDVVSLGLYTRPMKATGGGNYEVTYPEEDTQYAALSVLPDRGFYVSLVAGTMTLSLPEVPVAGSTLTMHRLTLEVTSDDFTPDQWMLGAKIVVQEAVATCTEVTDTMARWRWQEVGALTITTSDGQGREVLPWWKGDESTGTTTVTGDEMTIFPRLLRFAREGVLE